MAVMVSSIRFVSDRFGRLGMMLPGGRKPSGSAIDPITSRATRATGHMFAPARGAA